MNQRFEIRFEFPLDRSNLTISLKAIAELHHSDPYYLIYDFHIATANLPADQLSILPDQEIKSITRDDSKTWVHRDSGRESMLSLAIGKAIERVLEDQ